MYTEIGLIEGEILNIFEDLHSPLTIKELGFYLDQPQEFVLMAVGALLREGLIYVERCDGKLFVYVLKEESHRHPCFEETFSNVNY